MTNTPLFLQRFGLQSDADERTIRRTYARELKLIDQSTEPERFQELREIYEQALQWRRYWANHAAQEDTDGGSVEVMSDVAPVASSDTLPSASLDLSLEPSLEPSSDPLPPSDISHDSDVPPISTQQAPLTQAPEFVRIANHLFQQFYEQFSYAVEHDAPLNEAKMKAILDQCIYDPLMDDFFVREIVEARIVELLLSGWRRGHEVLFVVAGTSFKWLTDRSRLHRLGQIGYVLDQAYTERESFFQLTDFSRDDCRSAITCCRKLERPSNGDLLQFLPILEKMQERYPYLMPIIISNQHLDEWKKWYQEVPSWRRFSLKSSARKLNDKLPSNSDDKFLTPWRIAWIAIVAAKFIFFSH